MIKMSRKAKKAMAVALTAGMLASTAVTPVMAATQGWKQNSKGWWYQNADGSYPANKWEKINGKWYYFNANGYMLANAWAKDSKGLWYYVGADGAMKTNAWAPDKAGLWYYVGADGAMVTNTWKTDKNGLWYHLGADGVMEAGKWITLGDKSYFLDAEGVMQSGVIKVDGKTYYLGEANDGSMQTGTINIKGVDYTFDATTGACTDAKTPVAAKKFDKKGNLVTEEIEIEKIDGINAVVVNEIPEYAQYVDSGSVVMAGTKTTIKVLVTEDGNPVAGTSVLLTLNHEIGNDDYGVVGLQALTTDANGYAYFVVANKNEKLSPLTDDSEAVYSYTATAVASGEYYEGKITFASIDVGGIDVNKDAASKLVASQNAPDTSSQIIETAGISTERKNKYITSQQVNSIGGTEHEVTFEINPVIVIPQAEKVKGEYKLEINQKLAEYSVYEAQSYKIEKVPAGLKYATLYFDNIEISEHTQVKIVSYNAASGKALDTKYINATELQSTTTYSLPVQEDVDLNIEITILSEGQVNDKQNGGLTIRSIEGVYKAEKLLDAKKLPLENAVTWTEAKNQYNIETTLDATVAKSYLPTDGTYSTYFAEGNTYTVQIPTFPCVGNAIITVRNSNKEVLGYFTVPTVNYDYEKSKSTNVNNLVRPNNQAILVTEDEAFNNVGTVTTSGNKVTVNSDKTGVTALQAKIDIPGYDEIDLTNNTFNASVQWAPIPTEAENKDFYALTGQTITVKAQLIDKAGNKVSKAGTPINFAYGATATPILEEGLVGTSQVEVTSISTETDKSGCAELKLQATDIQAVLKTLTASSTSSQYNVVLNIGDEVVSEATLRWVTPGLKFTPAVGLDETKPADAKFILETIEGESFEDLDDATKDGYSERYLQKDAGTSWLVGYEVNGDTQDDKTILRKVSSITGLDIELTKDGDAEMKEVENGVALMSSTKANVTKLTSTLDEDSFVAGTEVIFKVATSTDNGKSWSSKDYVNVGEGVPFFEEEVSLTLPVMFGTVGTEMSVIYPKGRRVFANGNETVYIKVSDQYGNAIEEKALDSLTINYTGVDGNGKTISEKVEYNEATLAEMKTDEDGLVEVTILTSGEIGEKEFAKVTKATINAEYDNEKIAKDNAISFVEAEADFLLLNASYDEDTKKVTLDFSEEVNKDTLVEDMITIAPVGKNPVTITDITVSGKQVIATLKSDLKEENDYVVTIGDEVEVGGVPYSLCDKNGNVLEINEAALSVNAAKLKVTANDADTNGKFTVEINGVNANANIDVLAVWDDGCSQYTTDASGNIEINGQDFASGTEITFYYNGASTTAKTTAKNDAEQKEANTEILRGQIETIKAAMKDTSVNLTTVTITIDNYYSGVGAVVTDDNDGSVTSSSNVITFDTASAIDAETFEVEVSYGTADPVTLVGSVTVTDGEVSIVVSEKES